MKYLRSPAARCTCIAFVLVAGVTAPLSAQTDARGAGPRPSRATPDGAIISGRVLDAATSTPLMNARVTATAPELPGGRSVFSDTNGLFRIAGLPAGHYTIVASKPGYLDLVYGQRRPGMDGDVTELDNGEEYIHTDCRLLRGGVIAGRLVDEKGEAVAGATVFVMRYAYVRGERRLVKTETARTDDTGSYRVWGLVPGDYLVKAGTAAPAEEAADDPATAYFPGVAPAENAKTLALGISQELANVDIRVRGQSDVVER